MVIGLNCRSYILPAPARAEGLRSVTKIRVGARFALCCPRGFNFEAELGVLRLTRELLAVLPLATPDSH